MIGTEHDEPYFEAITDAITNHPRSQQRRIGPSQIGTECEVRLLHAINEDPEPERIEPAWKPTVGTAVHAWLEAAFELRNDRLGYRRWITEQRITVGAIGPTVISGSSDLFDLFTKTVYDHKCVGPKRLLHYRAHGPGEQYRIQAHLYGLGFFNESVAFGVPKEVAIAFLPREGELSRAYVWREAWDPKVALDALARANRLYDEIQAVGVEEACKRREPCDDTFCPWCGRGPSARTGGTFFNPTYGDAA